MRAREVQRARACRGGSGERIVAALGAAHGRASPARSATYDLEAWENQTVAEGSATVALRMADELGDRLRLRRAGAPDRGRRRGRGVRSTTATRLTADAVVCAVPVGPLRDIALEGLSPAAAGLAAAPAPRAGGQGRWSPTARRSGASAARTGSAESENLFGSTWPQGEGVLSILVPPERLLHHVSAADEVRRAEVLAALARIYGERAADPVAYLQRDWGVDPWTQGYVTQWAPGDVMAVGPLHGTHEPPFYVAGSDHWVAGYMEGAVRTGRAAARAILER